MFVYMVWIEIQARSAWPLAFGGALRFRLEVGCKIKADCKKADPSNLQPLTAND